MTSDDVTEARRAYDALIREEVRIRASLYRRGGSTAYQEAIARLQPQIEAAWERVVRAIRASAETLPPA